MTVDTVKLRTWTNTANVKRQIQMNTDNVEVQTQMNDFAKHQILRITEQVDYQARMSFQKTVYLQIMMIVERVDLQMNLEIKLRPFPTAACL
jgi:hypothetical protein